MGILDQNVEICKEISDRINSNRLNLSRGFLIGQTANPTDGKTSFYSCGELVNEVSEQKTLFLGIKKYEGFMNSEIHERVVRKTLCFMQIFSKECPGYEYMLPAFCGLATHDGKPVGILTEDYSRRRMLHVFSKREDIGMLPPGIIDRVAEFHIFMPETALNESYFKAGGVQRFGDFKRLTEFIDTNPRMNGINLEEVMKASTIELRNPL